MLTLLDHLLVALVVVGLPLRALHGIRVLRAADPQGLPALRRRLWTRAMAVQWTLAAAALGVWFAHHRDARALGLGLAPSMALTGVLVGLVTIVVIVLRQRGALVTEEALRARVRARLAPVERLMPRTAAEMPLFGALAATAGICEELLFRGYVLWYAAHFMPYALACVLQAVIFGICHAYQGRNGIWMTMFAGAFFTAVVVLTGSLYPAMLIHGLMDLHAGDLARRVFPPDPVPSPPTTPEAWSI